MTDSRYPYTYAADYVRAFVTDFNEEIGMRTTTMSRSEAAQARKAFAIALGMDDAELARKLADAYLADGAINYD
jgi:predicted protein tyrosine phosphatase